jgi:hypothetical protein
MNAPGDDMYMPVMILDCGMIGNPKEFGYNVHQQPACTGYEAVGFQAQVDQGTVLEESGTKLSVFERAYFPAQRIGECLKSIVIRASKETLLVGPAKIIVEAEATVPLMATIRWLSVNFA